MWIVCAAAALTSLFLVRRLREQRADRHELARS
jgi:hypothetical protein